MGHFIPAMDAEKLVFSQIVVRPAGGDEGVDEAFLEAIQAAAGSGYEIKLETDNHGSFLISPRKLLNLRPQFAFNEGQSVGRVASYSNGVRNDAGVFPASPLVPEFAK